MKTPPMLVGVVQLNCELLALDSNFNAHADWIRTAQSESIELLLFPELSLTGYQLGRRTPEAAMRTDDERLKTLARIAPKMTVVVGFVEQASPGEYYNAVAYLKHGEVAAVYRKINLPTYGGLEEGKWYHSGEDLVQVECKPSWNASTLICADLWNPALVHCAMLRRPEILLAPINSASAIVSEEFSNENNWQTNVNFYAMLYGVPVLMANRFGSEGDAWFWGGSRILGPRGEVLALAEDRECLISAELDLNAIAAARFDHPAMRDANTPLIQRLLKQS